MKDKQKGYAKCESALASDGQWRPLIECHRKRYSLLPLGRSRDLPTFARRRDPYDDATTHLRWGGTA